MCHDSQTSLLLLHTSANFMLQGVASNITAEVNTHQPISDIQ